MKRLLLMFLLSLAVFGGCASTQDDGSANKRYEKDGGQHGHSGHRY